MANYDWKGRTTIDHFQKRKEPPNVGAIIFIVVLIVVLARCGGGA